ncbi:MAG: Na+/H+ antiporter NhaA [Phycisphaerales bacterium]|nr:Na+/H+ antiporter NhaA [Phycisphaerales bacterium]
MSKSSQIIIESTGGINQQFQRFIMSPLYRLMRDSRAIGILLCLCALTSLMLANFSPFKMHYINLWSQPVPFIGSLYLPSRFNDIIDSGLMTLFFFIAGLEIKRELQIGELSNYKKAIMPVFAALGGMVVPAIIFSLINKGTIYAHGWGIPCATDIAFAIAVASFLGKRLPYNLRVFLLALAIIDDLGAMIIIALFYGVSINWIWGPSTILIAVALTILSKKEKKVEAFRIGYAFIHILLFILLWHGLYNMGIEATISGIIAAWVLPTKLINLVQNNLHKIVYFAILPLFVLCNTAINIGSIQPHYFMLPLMWGIFLGLLLGKPLGIYFICKILNNRKVGVLPYGTTSSNLIGMGILASLGFTMSIFIATIGFNGIIENTAKLTIVFTSIVGVLLSLLWFYVVDPNYLKITTFLKKIFNITSQSIGITKNYWR